jgi:uncharacterized protein YpmB
MNLRFDGQYHFLPSFLYQIFYIITVILNMIQLSWKYFYARGSVYPLNELRGQTVDKVPQGTGLQSFLLNSYVGIH